MVNGFENVWIIYIFLKEMEFFSFLNKCLENLFGLYELFGVV